MLAENRYTTWRAGARAILTWLKRSKKSAYQLASLLTSVQIPTGVEQEIGRV
jgi:hypothetical protein